MIPPNVSDLAGLLLHVVLAVHSVVDQKGFLLILETCMTTLRTCKSMFVSIVDGEDSKHEKTREFADIRMYHFC